MMVSSMFAIVFLAVVCLADSGRLTTDAETSQLETRVYPELQPKSSERFFNDDYPDDRRAKVVHKFKRPYPNLQDTDEFDRDFVKDENSDGGEWTAQSAYDSLKNKLLKKKKDLSKAKEESEDAVDRLGRASRAAERRAKRRAAAEESSDSSDSSGGTSGDSSTIEEVPAATAKVEDAVDNLEDCQKELDDARAKLKELMKNTDVKKQEGAQAAAALRKVADGAEEDELGAEKREKEMEDQSEEKQNSLKQANHRYENAQAKLEKMKADLKKAEAKLKKFRQAPDAEGGVYRTEEAPGALRGAAAPSARLRSGVLFVALGAALCAISGLA